MHCLLKHQYCTGTSCEEQACVSKVPQASTAAQWQHHPCAHRLPMSLGMICTNDTILVGPDVASTMHGSVNTVKTEAGVGVQPRDLRLLLE